MALTVWPCAVTLLALGNGAPDLSSSIAAVSAGHYELAINALLGAHTPSSLTLDHSMRPAK